jgi:hypothetical protein
MESGGTCLEPRPISGWRSTRCRLRWIKGSPTSRFQGGTTAQHQPVANPDTINLWATGVQFVANRFYINAALREYEDFFDNFETAFVSFSRGISFVKERIYLQAIMLWLITKLNLN